MKNCHHFWWSVSRISGFTSRIFVAAFGVTLVLLTGCASPRLPPIYYPDAEQRIDGADLALAQPGRAIVEFSTNTHEDTAYQQQVGEQLCAPDSDTRVATLRRRKILTDSEVSKRKLTSVFTLGLSHLTDSIEDDKPQTKVATVEAGKPLQLAVSSHVLEDNMHVNCGPLRLKFTPEESHVYKVEFRRVDRMCVVSVLDKTVAPPKRVPHSRWSCSTGMFSQGKVLNLRDVE